MNKQNFGRTAMLAMATSLLTFTYAASAASIGFVGGLTNGVLDDTFDLFWKARLETQGHTVTMIDQTTLSTDAVFGGLNLLIVSQDVGAGTFRSGVGINQLMPMLVYEPALYTDFFGAGNGSRAGVSGGVNIVNPTHPLAAGLTGDLSNVAIYTGTENISSFDVSGISLGTTLIGQMVSTPNNGVFAVLDAGAIGGGGNSWSHLRMAVPAHDTWNPNLVTLDGWKLLDNAVTYGLTTPVPEPSSIALIGLGMAFFLARRQRC
jgi:PEP-CTERM motif